VQLALPVVPVGAKLQLAPPEKVPTPAGEAVRVTAPVGVAAAPAEVVASDTVAVQLVAVATTGAVGAHVSDVALARFATVQLNVALPFAPVGSAAETVTDDDPTAVGVPEMSPEALEIDKPGGSPEAE
jgi:hypothetical protein